MLLKKTLIIYLLLITNSCVLFNRHRLNNSLDSHPKRENIVSFSDNFESYRTNRVFFYDAYQILVKDTIYFKLKASVLPHKSLKGALIEYDYIYCNDVIKNYNYQGRFDSVNNRLKPEKTTFLNSDIIFLHPPRAYTLKVLQLAPFPEFYKDGRQLGGALEIPKKSWGYWENSSIYISNNIDSIYYGNDSIPLKYFVTSKANSKYGENTASFEYQKDSGFVKMDYNYENGDKVLINLVKIEER